MIIRQMKKIGSVESPFRRVLASFIHSAAVWEKKCILETKELTHNLNDTILGLFYLNFVAFAIENEIEYRF